MSCCAFLWAHTNGQGIGFFVRVVCFPFLHKEFMMAVTESSKAKKVTREYLRERIREMTAAFNSADLGPHATVSFGGRSGAEEHHFKTMEEIGDVIIELGVMEFEGRSDSDPIPNVQIRLKQCNYDHSDFPSVLECDLSTTFVQPFFLPVSDPEALYNALSALRHGMSYSLTPSKTRDLDRRVLITGIKACVPMFENDEMLFYFHLQELLLMHDKADAKFSTDEEWDKWSDYFYEESDLVSD